MKGDAGTDTERLRSKHTNVITENEMVTLNVVFLLYFIYLFLSKENINGAG